MSIIAAECPESMLQYHKLAGLQVTHVKMHCQISNFCDGLCAHFCKSQITGCLWKTSETEARTLPAALSAETRSERKLHWRKLRPVEVFKETMALTILFERSEVARRNWLCHAVRVPFLAVNRVGIPDAEAYVIDSPKTAPPGRMGYLHITD